MPIIGQVNYKRFQSDRCKDVQDNDNGTKAHCIFGDERSTMDAHCRARQDSRWTVLVLGFDDWRLLPTVMSVTRRQSGQRPAPQ
jgi:hypothetical protein